MDNDEVAKRIMDYLHKHPDAGDTLEGIAKWWVKSVCIEESVNMIAAVLDNMTEKGLIKKHAVKDSTVLYKIKTCKEVKT